MQRPASDDPMRVVGVARCMPAVSAVPTDGRVQAGQGAGTEVGTTFAAPSVNLPSLTAMMVTPFWGTCALGREGDRAGDAREAGRRLDGALQCSAVHAAGAR